MRTDDGRTPFVLLHALAQDSTMWQAQQQALSAAGHRVLAPDQRGFGRSPLGDEPPSLDLVADDVARLMDQNGIERAVIAGASMGGYVAMTFVRRHPSRVAALGLLAARAAPDTPDQRAQREAFASAITDPHRRAALIDATAPLLLGATTRAGNPELTRRVRDRAEACDPHALAWAQRGIALRPDAFGVLREVRVPAVVVAGEQDELVSVGEAADTAAALPGAPLVVLPDCGHLAPLEAPEAVTASLCRLVDRAAVTR
jgi:pimeloyl-ACP methyl ester carboxylesterase